MNFKFFLQSIKNIIFSPVKHWETIVSKNRPSRIIRNSFFFVNIIGFYGLYIFWTGAEIILTPPQYKKMPLLIATVITISGIYIVTDLLLTMIIDRIFFAIFA